MSKLLSKNVHLDIPFHFVFENNTKFCRNFSNISKTLPFEVFQIEFSSFSDVCSYAYRMCLAIIQFFVEIRVDVKKSISVTHYNCISLQFIQCNANQFS